MAAAPDCFSRIRIIIAVSAAGGSVLSDRQA